ncbi:hypothetical protein HYN46_13440 [Aquirhabdus parva]|uniref:Uncharacterized protein n=2 Tax=Aquirhabdus parva TaxID=2283318 RepID=A0A345PBP8_9GAMM|nr:hypothetical protein HYN46_13440 [Aquirhabdus parva]
MWKTQPLPEERTELNFSASYSNDEIEKMILGVIPKEMEDKWFIYFQDNTLFFHRSWTGFCIFTLKFMFDSMGAHVVESWVNRNTSQYNSTSIEDDQHNLQLIIDQFLLHIQPKSGWRL